MKCFCLSMLLTCLHVVCFAEISPTKLTCEYLENPAVVDVAQPRLSWVNITGKNERGQIQTAYQIRVATSEKMLSNADLWDSKKLISEQNNRVLYGGKALASRTECWWQVRVWDKNGTVSAWSKPAFWRMGLLSPSDWKAKWIGAPWQGEEALPKPADRNAKLPAQMPPPSPLFRKEFNLEKKVKSAVAFVTGLGYFELYLNGKKVCDDLLVPNQTNYGKRPTLNKEELPTEDNFKEYKVMYLAYDIKNKLNKGNNVLGSILGNGFYNPSKHWDNAYGSPRFLAQVYIMYEDGTEDIIVSDESWKVAKSPILMDMVFYGEHYDARHEQTDWSKAGFDDTTWTNASLRNAPEGKLVAHTAQPDKVMERLKPIKIEKLANGNYHVDFGVEVSGWVRLIGIEGAAGQKIEINYLGTTFSGSNSYTCNGKKDQTYAARFNWFVFSEVEIGNWQGELKSNHITAEVVHTNIDETATFETSNSLFNTINKIWRRSMTDNMHSGVASDCPHRERSAYTGDGQVSCVTTMHNYDARSFYQKWIKDILGAQDVATGYVPNGAPWQPGCGGGVAWGAAICIMPWEFYLQYGSKDVLEDSFEGMTEYIRYMQTWVDKDGIMNSQRVGLDGKPLEWFNLGEWVTPKMPDDLPANELVHTFYFWRCADFTAQSAKALGKLDEAKTYSDLAEKTRNAFWKKFYDAEKGSYGKGGGNIFALKMGVPDNQYKRVVSAIRNDLKATNGNLDTGIFGTQFFFEILAENGMNELAYKAMNKRSQPSFGWWIEQGATTTWEQWNGDYSRNHHMFGGGLTWFYRKLAGMNADPEKPGYQHIVFRPQPTDDLAFVKYFNQTPNGKVGIYWRNNKQQFSMQVTVPVGSVATVYVPNKSAKLISENGNSISTSSDVKFIRIEPEYSVFSVKSGIYTFISK